MSPTKEEVAGAVERLTADLAETCPEGSRFANALVGKKDLRTLLQAYASETAARERLAQLADARAEAMGVLHLSLGEALEALKTAREGLSIAAGWARKKGDSDNARQIIKRGLDAIRETLRGARPSPSDTGVK